MTKQEEMFPKTELDEATAILKVLQGQEEKARKAAESASEKLYEATLCVAKQRHVVALIQKSMPAIDPVTGEVGA